MRNHRFQIHKQLEKMPSDLQKRVYNLKNFGQN